MMFNPETESPATENRPDAAFAAFADVIGVLANAKRFNATQAALRARLAAAIEATAAVQAGAEQMKKAAAAMYSTTAADDALRLRLATAIEKRKTLMPRRERLLELERAWVFVGESELVTRGFRAPEYGTALEKAQRACGVVPEADAAAEEPHFPTDTEALPIPTAPVNATVRRATPRRRGVHGDV